MPQRIRCPTTFRSSSARLRRQTEVCRPSALARKRNKWSRLACALEKAWTNEQYADSISQGLLVQYWFHLAVSSNYSIALYRDRDFGYGIRRQVNLLPLEISRWPVGCRIVFSP